MLGIIIYQNGKEYMDKIAEVINYFLVNYEMDYRLYKFNNYNEEFQSVISDRRIRKVFIIDCDNEESSWLDISLQIRERDWNSIIIYTTDNNKCYDDVFYNRLMALDFICLKSKFDKRLAEDIRLALKIMYRDKTFIFKYNYIVYHIPYNHICYIEKEPSLKRCIIHTINEEYYVIDSISNLSIKLGPGFYKTHQSCIVNIGNIKKINLCSNIITFKNGISTNLLSNKKKKDIKESIGLYIKIEN